MPKREYDWPSLLPEELSSVALQLSPSVQVCRVPFLFSGGLRLPTWVGHAIIGGEVTATAQTDCPIMAFTLAADAMVQQMEATS